MSSFSFGRDMKGPCRICKTVNRVCYEHCQERPDGKHEPLPFSGSVPSDTAYVVDYLCKYCKQSGGVIIDPNSIVWG